MQLAAPTAAGVQNGAPPHVNNVEVGRIGRWRSNVWACAGASSAGSDAREGHAQHPTVKPRALLEDALFDVTERNDIVIDSFVGSDSTLLAAEKPAAAVAQSSSTASPPILFSAAGPK